ncbi:MAG: hypothetical protein PHI12_11900 [Dehalococcoidales bacterium]|nr:hypothetical protein [Dehalococcoidales bacterium]
MPHHHPELGDLVSSVYTLCDEMEEGPNQWLVDFAGWCLEEAMMVQQDSTPEEIIKEQLAEWLKNREER